MTELQGTGKVFSFTFVQFWKTKSNIVSLVILLLFALASVPVGTLLAGGGFGASFTEPEEPPAAYAVSGLSPAQQAVMNRPVSFSVSALDDYGSEDEGGLGAEYWIQLVYAIVVMMVSIFSVSYIVRAVVEEKASKLVELLMVSVKPLALILGKILAAMLYVAGTFLLLFLCLFLSYRVSGLFMDVSALGGMLAGMGLGADSLRLGAGTALVVLVSLLLGYLTFAILAGLSGTGCSSMEEIQEAVSGSTGLIMLCYIASLFVSTIGTPLLVKIGSLCPVLSVFVAPVQYVAGNIGWGTLLLSWVIQLAVIALLALFAARVYSTLLIHRGSRVKLRQMLSMARKEAV